jgi:glyoxalase superfamily protein
MAVRFYQLVIDARDPRSIARFWAAVLDQKVLFESDDEVIVGSDEHRYPGLCFVPVPEHKTVKNRLHIDLDPDELDAEVERIIALGARRGDVGQGLDAMGRARRSRGQRVLRAPSTPFPRELVDNDVGPVGLPIRPRVPVYPHWVRAYSVFTSL